MSDEDQFSEVQVDFDFMSAQESDFYGLKALVKQAFNNQVNSSHLADAIIAQPTIGTVVKVDDQADPYAVITCFNLKQHDELADWFKEKADKPVLGEWISKGQVGFVLNERLLNMPPDIVPPMLEMLLDEVQGYKYLLFMAKVYYQVTDQKKSKEMFFFQLEDELMSQQSEWKVTFELPSEHSSDSKASFFDYGLEPFRMLYAVPIEKAKDILTTLQQMFQ